MLVAIIMNWTYVAGALTACVTIGMGVAIYNTMYYHSPEHYMQVITQHIQVQEEALPEPKKISYEEARKAHANYYRCKQNNLPISDVDKQIINDYVDYEEWLYKECWRKGGCQCTWFPAFDRVV